MSRAMLAHAAESAAPARSSVSGGFSASTLRINRPGDSYEQEADRAADQVVSNAPASTSARKAAWSLSKVSLQAPLQREPDQAPERVVAGPTQRAAWSPSGVELGIPNDPGEKQKMGLSVAVDRALRSPGRPLDATARGNFERHFRRDLSGVRLHTDVPAERAAESLNAAAFTVGTDIVFARGRYAPRTAGGRLLLLHELRHVEQQRSAMPTPTPEVDPPHSIHEGAARRLLDPHVDPLPVQRVQCAPDDPQFSLGGGAVDTVGKAAFGESSWPFMKAVFEGFVGGLLGDVKSGRADKAKDHLTSLLVPWNAVKFYAGYLVGLVVGLVSPITDLVKGVIGIVRLAISALEWLAKWSPVGVAISSERQQKIARLMQAFSDLTTEFGNALKDFVSDPKGAVKKFSGFLDNLMQMALGKARELGAKAAHSIFDFLEKDYFDMGQGIGEVIGALIAQVLLLVFTEAIGNLVAKGASFVGKAAEFAAGKAVEVFEWVKGFVGEVVSLLRNAVKGALKLFEGLVNKAVEAFDSLAALFTESEALESGGEKAAAGVGSGVGAPAPNVMESRMVSPTRTAPATVSDLRPPRVHPSNVPGSHGTDVTKAATKKEVMGPKSTEEAVKDLEQTGGGAHPREAATIGTEIEQAEIRDWAAELANKGYETYPRNRLGEGRIGGRRLSSMFTDQRARPDMIAINQTEKTIIVGDITANPGSRAAIPGQIGQEEGLHIEKTIEYAKQLKGQLPADYKVFAQDRHWQTGSRTKLIEVP